MKRLSPYMSDFLIATMIIIITLSIADAIFKSAYNANASRALEPVRVCHSFTRLNKFTCVTDRQE